MEQIKKQRLLEIVNSTGNPKTWNLPRSNLCEVLEVAGLDWDVELKWQENRNAGCPYGMKCVRGWGVQSGHPVCVWFLYLYNQTVQWDLIMDTGCNNLEEVQVPNANCNSLQIIGDFSSATTQILMAKPIYFPSWLINNCLFCDEIPLNRS